MTLGRLALIVGHSPASLGAFAVTPLSIHEYDYNAELALLIQEFAGSYNIECQIFKRIPDLKTAYRKANFYLTGQLKAALIELHFNAGISTAQGTETLYLPKNPHSERLAILVQGAMCISLKRLGRLNRGIKPLLAPDRGYENLELSEFPACLTEPFFGTNVMDATLGLEEKPDLAEAICIGAKLFLKDDGP